MNDLERLILWMKQHDFDYRSVANATGDTKSSVNMMINGKRDINDAFKWRFRRAFGDEAANLVFDEQPAPRELAGIEQ